MCINGKNSLFEFICLHAKLVLLWSKAPDLLSPWIFMYYSFSYYSLFLFRKKKSILLEWGWIHLESYKREKQYHYSSWLIGHVFVISLAKRLWNWKRTRSIWHTWRFIVCTQNVGKKNAKNSEQDFLHKALKALLITVSLIAKRRWMLQIH